MNEKLKLAIDDFTSGIWDIFKIGKSDCIDLKAFVKELDGTVSFCNEIPDGMDGMLIKHDDAFEICVYKNLSSERIRFTIAHEIGHLFLHCGYIVNSEKWKAFKDIYHEGEYEKEIQANEFAYSLLMPTNRFKAYIIEHSEDNEVDMGPVARNFHVTITSAIHRARGLKIIL